MYVVPVGVVHRVPDDHHNDVEPKKRSSHIIIGILEPPSSIVITCLPLAPDQHFDILVIAKKEMGKLESIVFNADIEMKIVVRKGRIQTV